MSINTFKYQDIIDIISNDIFNKLNYKIVDTLPEENLLSNNDLGTILLKKNNDKMLLYFIWKDNSDLKIYKMSPDIINTGNSSINIIELDTIPDSIDDYEENTLIISKDNKVCIIYKVDNIKKSITFNNNSNNIGGDVELISYETLLKYFEEV